MSEEEEVCDLSVVLAPLSKDQLEILIVKLIGRNEEIGDDVMRTAPKPREYLTTRSFCPPPNPHHSQNAEREGEGERERERERGREREGERERICGNCNPTD